MGCVQAHVTSSISLVNK